MKDLAGAPSQEQIEQWKAQFGEVFVSGFSEEELFIWKPVNRAEWIELQKIAGNPDKPITQFEFEELVCDSCILWKSVTCSWDKGKAGTPGSLQEQILQNSNFLSPQGAQLLVAKL